jgi:hypothetical protein
MPHNIKKSKIGSQYGVGTGRGGGKTMFIGYMPTFYVVDRIPLNASQGQA